MGSPAKSAEQRVAGKQKFGVDVLRLLVHLRLHDTPVDELVRQAGDELLRQGLIQDSSTSAAGQSRRRPTTNSGASDIIKLRAYVLRTCLRLAMPQRVKRVRSLDDAANWFNRWLSESRNELVSAERPLSDLELLDDVSLRAKLDLAVGGATFFDRVAQNRRRNDRYVVAGSDLGGWPSRSELRRRCAELLADEPWATEALDRTLGHPAVIDIVGSSRVSPNTRAICQSLLVDMPAGAAGALNAALFDALGPVERHRLDQLFADSPHATSMVWFPASWASMQHVHVAATMWLERNAPAPSLFSDESSGDDPEAALRRWMSDVANLFAPKEVGNGVYMRRNAPNGPDGSLRLNADMFAVTAAELANRARLACAFSGTFVGRDPRHRPLFEMDGAAVAAMLVERLGRPLQQSDLALLPAKLAAVVAPSVPSSSHAEGTLVIGDGKLLSSVDILAFALDPARNNVLPSKAQIENLGEVEKILGMTWKDYCTQLIAEFPELRVARSSYERRLDELLLELTGTPAPIEVPVRDATPDGLLSSSRCRIDAVWRNDEYTWVWFEADGEGHFVPVKNWSLDKAREGDRRRHEQLRAALDAGCDVTLVAMHHRLLSSTGAALDHEMLADVLDWARDEGYHWVFLRPRGCLELRASLSSPSEQTSVCFGDVEVVVAERRRVACHT